VITDQPARVAGLSVFIRTRPALQRGNRTMESRMIVGAFIVAWAVFAVVMITRTNTAALNKSGMEVA
jgi:hypothetical protein